MTRYRLRLEYDGTGYRGWQAQTNARSVQGTLLATARTVLDDPAADLQGAGRTDAGVHALGQVAHLDTGRRLEPDRLLRQLNDALPADIHILSAEPAPARFHARHTAVARTYLYQIARRRTAFAKRYVWWVRDPLDPVAMATAAAHFTGRHDFAPFADHRAAETGSTRVEVEAVTVAEAGALILVQVRGSHFLWRMVRRMVGVLVEVGRGTLPASRVPGLLRGPAPEVAAWTAPPSGLFLRRVSYPGDPPDPPPSPAIPVFEAGTGP